MRLKQGQGKSTSDLFNILLNIKFSPLRGSAIYVFLVLSFFSEKKKLAQISWFSIIRFNLIVFDNYFKFCHFFNSGLRNVKLDCYPLVTNELLIALRSDVNANIVILLVNYYTCILFSVCQS